jgi:hypothetical protein
MVRSQQVIPGGPKRGDASLMRPLEATPGMPFAISGRYVAIRTNAATVIAAVCAGGSMITSALVAVCQSVSHADHRMIGMHQPRHCGGQVKIAAAGCEFNCRIVNC